ncbi:MAG TPA: response regulator [Planctomycetota bacterium]|nr:response regulator [Planctomycetota bacterium]HRR82480.1 response regulator [Planctomycetota bacterium]HRT94298.1 response regulator [Planctomycetota bacterium]
MAYLLIVDDDEDFASAAAMTLRASGHEVDILLETTDALSRMKARTPDLVVLDVMFPESSSAGFDLAREIRDAGQPVAKVPILMLTAVNQKFPFGFSASDIDDHWMPVQDFLEKPVDIAVLCRRVNDLLARAT